MSCRPSNESSRKKVFHRTSPPSHSPTAAKTTRKLSLRRTRPPPVRGYLGPANVQLILSGVLLSSFVIFCDKRRPRKAPRTFSCTVHLSRRVAPTGCVRSNPTDRPTRPSAHRPTHQPIRTRYQPIGQQIRTSHWPNRSDDQSIAGSVGYRNSTTIFPTRVYYYFLRFYAKPTDQNPVTETRHAPPCVFTREHLP